MKIAQIAPIIERVPPKKYGGTERVIFALTEELVRMGHEVTLFASGDSITSAKLVSVYPRALRSSTLADGLYGMNFYTMLHIGSAYTQQHKFDIIHDHNGHISLPTANIADTPVIMTLHGAFNSDNKRIFQALKKPYFVSISKSQMTVSGLNYAGNVYNGLEMSDYPFSETHKGYLLFVGRLNMEKGVHQAIEVAKRLNLPLIIAAKLDKVDEPYYHQYIEPELNEQIRWIGEVDDDERNELMSKALCFLHPITWPEPFGLTLIESMACGCPVIAVGLGSIPEIILDGKTGFIVNNVDEMTEAVKKVSIIDRKECRRHALKNFSAKKMAEGYEQIYRQIIAKNPLVPEKALTAEKEILVPKLLQRS
jgi:glycosyltransferase involved in cell wall biosynthesis